MSEGEQQVYWVEDEAEAKQGFCMLNDTGKLLSRVGERYRCYCKWDDSIHFWIYEGDSGFLLDTEGIAGERGHSNYSYYWCIGGPEELDLIISLLQAIKPAATEWYAKRGKRWPPDWDAYVEGSKTIEQAVLLEGNKGSE